MSDDSAPLHLAAISLGSNIDPVENLKAAVRELARSGIIHRVSRVWESAPVGDFDQPNFLNAALLWETSLPWEELKPKVLAPIERNLKRVRDPQNINAPRTIDLDLSLFLTPTQSWVLDAEILSRAFVAIPLAEILPEFIHPDTGQTLNEIAAKFDPLSEGLLPRPDCELRETINRR